MRHIVLVLLLAGQMLGLALAAGEHDDKPAGVVRTAKERLTDKPSDEQRVDDCNVPPAQRSRVRPTDCHAQ